MSALKPVGPQGTSPQSQLNKPQQSAYGQSNAHMSSGLMNLSHGNANPAHQQPNHYALNVPHANQSYSLSSPIPVSNHPVAAGGQHYSPSKGQQQFSAGYQQPNAVQSTPTNSSNNPVPPVSQALRATVDGTTEKPQSNGTAETKNPEKSEETAPKENHITQESESRAIEQPKQESETAPKPAPSIENETKDKVQSAVSEAKTENVSDTSKDVKDASPPTPKAKEQEKKVVTPSKSTQSPRTPARKSKTPKTDSESPKKAEFKPLQPQKSPIALGGKSKRNRTRTQPYQSPLPEIEIVTKISSATPKNKATDDKLIVFYKHEFLAVRNSEGSFYICQAVQNIYKTSPRIRIRWLSQDKGDKSGEIYTPDFYDHTDFDCILTNLKLDRVNKGRYQLPPEERERTDSILKRSLAVEKGEVTSPSLTEEHPDGIDVSLYKEESQLKKKRGTKRRAPSSSSSSSTPRKVAPKKPEPKKRKVEPKVAPKAQAAAPKKRAPVSREPAPSTSRTDRARRRDTQASKVSPIVDQKKAKVLAKFVTRTTKNAKASTSTATSKRPTKAANKNTKRTRK